MGKRRVVVTGIGVIAPNGIGKDAFWDACVNGKSGIGLVSRFDASDFPTKIAGEVKNFSPHDYMTPKEARRIDRFAHFAIASSILAVKDTNLIIDNNNSENIGVVIGTSTAGLGYAEEQYKLFTESGYKKINPFAVASIITASSASEVSLHLGVKGPSLILSTACASGTNAVGYAAQLIQNGDIDMMIAGGAEAPIFPFSFAIFCASRVLSTRNNEPEKACRPFDKDRDGTVISEGAGMLILEDLDHALKRKAPIYAEIVGFGSTCDAFGAIKQEPTGGQAERAMRLALKTAGINPEDIDYINAHGSSTIQNDKIETDIIKDVFGKHAYKLAISSTKSMIGHLQGGCAGPEIIATCLAIKEGIIPPTINLDNPDKDCDLDYVPNKSRKKSIKYALKNTFGFGGKNAAIVLKLFGL
ncbi:MAG: beta-ketoacyl-ACP synthase II [Candidatus Margulisiibacteriota bacterium]